jgi:hypothetical protein
MHNFRAAKKKYLKRANEYLKEAMRLMAKNIEGVFPIEKTPSVLLL